MTSKDEYDEIKEWRTAADRRQRGERCDQVLRGPRHWRQLPDAPGSWRAEGKAQCPGQMDVWECIHEAANGS